MTSNEVSYNIKIITVNNDVGADTPRAPTVCLITGGTSFCPSSPLDPFTLLIKFGKGRTNSAVGKADDINEMLFHCSSMPDCSTALSESRSESRGANNLAVCCDCSFSMSNILCDVRCSFFPAHRRERSLAATR